MPTSNSNSGSRRLISLLLYSPNNNRPWRDPSSFGTRQNTTAENYIKAVKCDLHSDRTSATTFLANAMRLLLACAAYVLHHALRTHTLQHTALAKAQPSTVILTLFKIATQIKQYKDTIAPYVTYPTTALARVPPYQ